MTADVRALRALTADVKALTCDVRALTVDVKALTADVRALTACVGAANLSCDSVGVPDRLSRAHKEEERNKHERHVSLYRT